MRGDADGEAGDDRAELGGAGGLFFLPWIAASFSSWTGVEMLTRGLPSLDMALFGPLAHGNPLFMSALRAAPESSTPPQSV